MTLTQTSVACHVFPALGPWCSLTLTFALPEAVSVPESVHKLGPLLAPLIHPLLTLLVLGVVNLGEWVGGRAGVEGPGSTRGWSSRGPCS